MVGIQPFKAYRYNPEKIDDFSKVITPPYDVIDEEQRREFQSRSLYNFSRIILGEKEIAARLLDKWIREEILVQDSEDSIYVYSQKYQNGKAIVQRIGFIGLLDIKESNVHNHEKTMKKPLNGRLELMKATKANVGQIFCLYGDQQKIVDDILLKAVKGKKPNINFSEQAIEHNLWRISDKKIITNIQNEMKKYDLIIADGHHRFKTRQIFSEQYPELNGAKYSMTTFVNSYNDGLLMFPTNRLVYAHDFNKEVVLRKLLDYFVITRVRDDATLVNNLEKTKIMIDKRKNLKNHVFGLYFNTDKSYYLLELKNKNILNNIKKSDICRKLDINIAHKIIIEDVLGIKENEQENKLKFVKGNRESIGMLKNNDKFSIGIFVNPPLMREVFLTARNNELMPSKSTFFYPKIYSGLAIYSLKGG